MEPFDQAKADSLAVSVQVFQENCVHDHEWIDDSFSHDLGTESCGHWECVDCGHVDDDMESPQPQYEDDQ